MPQFHETGRIEATFGALDQVRIFTQLRRSGHRRGHEPFELLRMAWSPLIGLLTACGQNGGDGLIQPGEIIGGGTLQMSDVRPVAGFLPNTSFLRPGSSGEPDLYYRNPAANFSSYNKVMLHPVIIWAPPNTSLDSVPPDQRQ